MADEPASDEVVHSSHWGAFVADVDNGRLDRVRPFPIDPEPSPIIDGIPQALTSKARVSAPAVRRSWLDGGPGARTDLRGADEFVRVPWDEAVSLVAGELARVRDDHGNEAIFAGSYGWASAGRFHHAKTQLARLMNCIGGFTAQRLNYSFAAAAAVLPHVLGDAGYGSGDTQSWDMLVDHGRLWVMFGGMPVKNTQVESGGVARHTAGEWFRRLNEAGVRFVSVSPVRDDAPGVLGARWLAPRPNTDTALMLGLAHTLLDEGLHDEAFLRRYCTGWEVLRGYLLGQEDGVAKSADWAARICDLDPGTIRDLAREMAATRTYVTATWSLQRADHGEQPYWMVIALAAMLGQIGLPGGGFGFGYGSESAIGESRYPFPAPALSPGTNPSGSWIPVARIADMLLDPGGRYEFGGEVRTYPDTRLIYWAGGNPFHHHQDLNRLVEAWRRPETIIVNEIWWTATARHADIVLPATTTLERNDIGAASRDSYLIAMHQAVEPVGGARNDFDIFADIAALLGVADRFTEGRTEMEWIAHLYERTRKHAMVHGIDLPEFEEFWAAGSARVWDGAGEVPLAAFRLDPESHPLATPSGRIELFSSTVDGFGYDDCPGHPTWLEPGEWLGAPLAAAYPLHLISNQPATRLHSQLDMVGVSAAAKIAGREPCRMNPADARARGLADGDVVRVYNHRGSCLAGLRVDDGIRASVVQLSTGAWYDPLEPGTPGTPDVHGNPNVLTPDRGTSRLAQGPSAHSTLVEVESFDGDLPPITVFEAPELHTLRGR